MEFILFIIIFLFLLVMNYFYIKKILEYERNINELYDLYYKKEFNFESEELKND